MKTKNVLLVAALLISVIWEAKAQNAHFSYFAYSGNDARFREPIDRERQYFNPVLAGFYPDPSCCRVDDTYYLVNSSFAFFPGIPIFESHDLVNWTQIGHVLDRASQLPLEGQGVSGGIYAPDIKYNDRNKTFYVITTNVGTGNFFVKTHDPHVGWTEPLMLPEVEGIDPSFFFDDDGQAWIVHNAPVAGEAAYEGERAIRLLRFDVEGDSVITRGTPNERGWWEIVRGGSHVEAQPIWIEGPHLFRVGAYYYLMCAEGGTGDWHSEVVFRASVNSDIRQKESWEECPWNPILTQRDIYAYVTDKSRKEVPADAVTSTGHADLVQARDGSWWAVFLGCRPYESTFYNTGRDTYLLPVSWKAGWPEILPKGSRVPAVVDKAGLEMGAEGLTGNFSYVDDFSRAELNHRWIFLRNPDMSRFTWGNGLTIEAGASESTIFCRQQHTCFTAETEVRFEPVSPTDLAGLALFQNETHRFVFGKTLLDGEPAMVLKRTDGEEALIAHAKLSTNGTVRLKVEGDGSNYSFYYAETGTPTGTKAEAALTDGWTALAVGVDGINLSTSRAGGFVGTCIGLTSTGADMTKKQNEDKNENSVSRPQTPQPPFPYTTEEVTFFNPGDSAWLAGTLTLPHGKQKGLTVVLMVTGSGQQNRDEELFGHKPFCVIADHLARHGIASLRYDDRGFAQSKGGMREDCTTEDFLRDAEAGLRLLHGDGRFKHIGILGHSEGATIAFMAGARCEADFVVSLAGVGIRGDSALTAQGNAILQRRGLPPLQTVATLRVNALVLNNPWLNWFLDYDPTPDISATCCPVFAVNGGNDLQVVARENLEAIRSKLPANRLNVVRVYPELNHLFQHSRSGLVEEYAELEETFAPEVLDDLVKFLLKMKTKTKAKTKNKKRKADKTSLV